MKEEIKLIGKIDFKDEDVNIYHDPLKDVNNIDVSWQMRNPSLVSYPEDVVIPEQTEYDREYLPKFIFTGQDTITKEFITKVIDKLNYGFYERNIGE